MPSFSTAVPCVLAMSVSRPSSARQAVFPSRTITRGAIYTELFLEMRDAVLHHRGSGFSASRKIMDRAGDKDFFLLQPDIPDHLTKQFSGLAHKRSSRLSLCSARCFTDEQDREIARSFSGDRFSRTSLSAKRARPDLICYFFQCAFFIHSDTIIKFPQLHVNDHNYFEAPRLTRSVFAG